MPRERTELPCTFYRITVELPCVVAFPSATYHIALESILAAGRHELTGYNHARGVAAIIGPFYRTRDLLIEAVWTAGVPVRCDTIGATIMRKMVREGRAVVVVPPTDDPAKRWPRSGAPLSDGARNRLNIRQLPWPGCTALAKSAATDSLRRLVKVRSAPSKAIQHKPSGVEVTTCVAGSHRRSWTVAGDTGTGGECSPDQVA